MRTRFEAGGGAATVFEMRRRWLASLLAFAVGAALVALTPSPVRADNGVFATVSEFAGTIHGDGGNDDPTEEVADEDNVYVEIDEGAEIVMVFPGDIFAVDGAGADIRIHTVDSTNENSASVFVSADGDDWIDLGTHPDYETVETGVFGVDIDLDDFEEVGVVKFVKLVGVNLEGEDDSNPGFDLDAVEALNYDEFPPLDTCDPNIDDDCTATDDNGTTATVDCLDEDCPEIVLTPAELDGGDKAAFNVVPTGPDKEEFSTVVMVVTMGSKQLSTPPGRAVVEFFPDEGGSYLLDRCVRTDNPNCIIQIKRVEGALTQYTIQFAVDPRLSFR